METAVATQDEETPVDDDLTGFPAAYDPTKEHVPNIYAPKGIPLDRVRELITTRGMSYAEAAKILGCSKVTVWQRCQRHGIMSQGSIKRFRAHRADVLANKQAMILNTLTEEDIKAQSAYQRVGMFGILYDKERLELDKSTENIAGLQHVIDSNKDILEGSAQAMLERMRGASDAEEEAVEGEYEEG